MVILSIDASTKATGYAIFTDGSLTTSGVINATEVDLFKRLEKMRVAIIEILEKYKPDHVYMEEVLPEDVNNNQKTFKALIYLQAFIVKEIYNKKIPYDLIVASHWRKQCGIKTGPGITRETLKKKAIDLIKTKYNKIVTDDEADAICIGYAALIDAPSQVKQKPKTTPKRIIF